MIFIKILKNKIQIKNEKKIIAFDDVIADMHNNEQINKIVNESFIRERKLNISLFLSRNNILKYQKMLD